MASQALDMGYHLRVSYLAVTSSELKVMGPDVAMTDSAGIVYPRGIGYTLSRSL
jgi:hypothetical protein